VPTPSNVIFFESAADLRAWFEANHNTASELWVGFHNRRSGRPSITWNELVDQELCFGWIDSVRYRLDESRSAQRVTPRRKRSVWSGVNVRRFEELDSLGVVHPHGLAVFRARDESRSGIYAYENRHVGLGPEMEKKFRAHPDAWEFYARQAPWYRRTAAYWVVSARRGATREKRLQTLIDDSAAGRRLRQLARPQTGLGVQRNP
jgi:uncharacterized protein YdeI (YjbR/CyaY-like superfamily)